MFLDVQLSLTSSFSIVFNNSVIFSKLVDIIKVTCSSFICHVILYSLTVYYEAARTLF